jgi:phosphate transport system permease protein
MFVAWAGCELPPFTTFRGRLLTDISLSEPSALTARVETARRAGAGDTRFRLLALAAALTVLLIFAGVITSLLIGSMPAFKAFGFGFLTSQAWSPTRDNFGALAPIYGTLVTSIIAMVIAVPVGIGVAIFLTDLCPRPLRRPIGIAIELLAGIPSIIYGIWGLFVFAPWFQEHIEGPTIDALVDVPVLGTLFGGAPFGIGTFTAGLILSIMILPFISAVTRDVLETVPSVLKEASYGLGATSWEVMWKVCLPFCQTGVVGGAMLALGRALGETMAVTFVIGNAHKIAPSLFAPGTSISATIANEFTEATTPLYTSCCS